MFYSPIFGEYYWYQPVHKRKHATGKVIWVPFNYRNIIWTLSLVFFVISWQKSTLSSLSPHTQWRLIEGEIESIENNMLLQSNPIETNETTYLWLNPLFDWTPESALQWGLDLRPLEGPGFWLDPWTRCPRSSRNIFRACLIFFPCSPSCPFSPSAPPSSSTFSLSLFQSPQIWLASSQCRNRTCGL